MTTTTKGFKQMDNIQQNKLEFGITYVSSSYRDNEIYHFTETFSECWSEEFCNRYKAFLDGLRDKTIKSSSFVDVDILKEFQSDCDNRYDIDYCDEYNRREYGNKALYFKKLSDHVKSLLDNQIAPSLNYIGV